MEIVEVGREKPARVGHDRRARARKPECRRIADKKLRNDRRPVGLGKRAPVTGRTARRAVAIATPDVQQVAVVGERVVIQQVCESGCEADSAVVADLGSVPVLADGAVERFLAIPEREPRRVDAVRPLGPLVLGHRVGHDPHAAKGFHGLEGHAPLQELEVANARPALHRARLPKLADPDRAEEGDLLLLSPDVHEARPPGLREVKHDRVVGEIGELAKRLESSPPEAHPVERVADALLAGLWLAEEAVIELEEAAQADDRQLVLRSLPRIEAGGLLEAEIDVARLVWVEHGSGPRAAATIQRLSCSQVDIASLARIQNGAGRGKHFLGTADAGGDVEGAREACHHARDEQSPTRHQPTPPR